MQHRMTMSVRQREQRGAVAIIVGLTMAVMVGFAGLALDGGRLYITKTELQNAADACALSASFELTGSPNIPAGNFTSAQNAGRLAAQRNRVGFQATDINPGNVTVEFASALTGGWASAATPPSGASRFVRCTIPQAGIVPWFMQVLGVGPSTVRAAATASLVRSGGTGSCNGLPIGICAPAPTGSAPYGLTPGQWYSGGLSNAEQLTGSFNWVDYSPPNGGASELAAALEGSGACLTSVGSQVGQTGAAQSLRRAWNTHFGIYANNYNINAANLPIPDQAGYSYRPQNWPSQFNALANLTATRRPANTPYGSPGAQAGNAITGLSVQNNNTVFQQNQLAARGSNRRVMTAPIVNCGTLRGSQTAPILDYACVLMLHPLDNDNNLTLYMEYIGLASAAGAPCSNAGVPGGPNSTGPYVPGLVQ